jgi:hypothetical protein
MFSSTRAMAAGPKKKMLEKNTYKYKDNMPKFKA